MAPVVSVRLNSFKLRLVTHFGGLFLLISVALTVYLDISASATLNKAKRIELFGIATGTATLLARQLHEREREIALLSKSYVLTQLELDNNAVQTRLHEMQQSYPFYAWIGVVAPDGTVMVATNDILAGKNVAQRPWFKAGLKQLYVGDVHEAVLLAQLLGTSASEPLRFIDFAAPVRHSDGRVRAVVAAHVHWNWVHDLVNAVHSDDVLGDGMELLILGQQGQWLHPYNAIGRVAVPADLPPAGQVAVVNWPEQGRFFTAKVNVKTTTDTNSNALGWQVVLRQPLKAALQPVAELNKQLFLFCLFALLLGGALAYWLASLFSRPVEQLAQAASKVAQGEENVEFAVGSALHEVRHLSAALRSMMNNIALKRRALVHANENLEQQVALRTADLERANNALRELARKDPLTTISNRRAADEQLNSLFNMLQRGGGRYAVLLLDIDHFKRINDNFGHDVGDQVIQRVAVLLQSQLRETDLVARYGGEEFIVLLPNTELDGAMVIADKLCRYIASDSLCDVGQITVSIGVALAKAEHTDAEMVVRHADKAMYQAKRGGRNQVVRYTDIAQ